MNGQYLQVLFLCTLHRVLERLAPHTRVVLELLWLFVLRHSRFGALALAPVSFLKVPFCYYAGVQEYLFKRHPLITLALSHPLGAGFLSSSLSKTASAMLRPFSSSIFFLMDSLMTSLQFTCFNFFIRSRSSSSTLTVKVFIYHRFLYKTILCICLLYLGIYVYKHSLL